MFFFFVSDQACNDNVVVCQEPLELVCLAREFAYVISLSSPMLIGMSDECPM